MTNFDIGLLSFAVMLALIFLRMPIGLAMLLVGLGGSYVVNGSPNMLLASLKHQTYGIFSNHSFSIVPLFLLMGQFASVGGMSKSLFKGAEAWLGHRRGGVAMSAIGACAAFGAICGSSLATAATMAQVALPELRRYGYSPALATGTLAAGGTLGILIPPSIVLVIYAILAEQNIAKLFAAAFIPGILAAIGYMIAISIYVRVVPGSGGELRPRMPYGERFVALFRTSPVIGIFLIIFVGIYGGFFTPTEAAAIGAALTGLVAWYNGGLSGKSFIDSALATASATAMIFLIVLGAAVFNGFLALTQLPQISAAWVAEQGFNPWLVLAVVLVLYLFLGCIMDSLSMILLTIPIFFPIMSGLDFGLSPEEFAIWFGILVLIVVEVGLITPPVGMNLFVINAMARDIKMVDTMRGVMPFVVTDLIRTTILAAFPPITLLTLWLFY